MDGITSEMRSKETNRHFGHGHLLRRGICAAAGVSAVFLAYFAVSPAEAHTIRRSFKNGYPAEWNISREQAEDTFSIKGSKVTYSDGKGRIVSTDNGTVSQRNVRVVCPYRKAKRLRTPSNKSKAKPANHKSRTK